MTVYTARVPIGVLARGPAPSEPIAARMMLLGASLDTASTSLVTGANLSAHEIPAGGGYTSGGVAMTAGSGYPVWAYGTASGYDPGTILELDIGTAGLTSPTMTATWRHIAIIGWSGSLAASRLLTLMIGDVPDSVTSGTIKLTAAVSVFGTGLRPLVNINAPVL